MNENHLKRVPALVQNVWFLFSSRSKSVVVAAGVVTFLSGTIMGCDPNYLHRLARTEQRFKLFLECVNFRLVERAGLVVSFSASRVGPATRSTAIVKIVFVLLG